MLNTRMLVDAEAVKLRHPSFIIPTIDNSCAVYEWGISSRLPKLFTFQRARDLKSLQSIPAARPQESRPVLKQSQGGI